MKFLLLLLFIPFTNTDLSIIRNLYKVASQDKAKAHQLLAIVEKTSSINPIFFGYKGATKIIMAKYAFNPFTKWNRFNEGKDILETAIKSDANNLELRYLRLTIQLNTPNILGYKSDIDSDKIFLKRNINIVNDEELRKIIKNYLFSLK